MDEPAIFIAREPVQRNALDPLLEAWFGTMVKAVADIERGIIALGGEWHIDANNVLLADGSAQQDVWGFNIYPDATGDDALEYVSLINIRPAAGNRDMEIEDEAVRARVKNMAARLLPFLNV